MNTYLTCLRLKWRLTTSLWKPYSRSHSTKHQLQRLDSKKWSCPYKSTQSALPGTQLVAAAESLFTRSVLWQHIIWIWSKCYITTTDIKTQLQSMTQSDYDLQQLMQLTENGWPARKSKVPSQCLPYWSFQEQISFNIGFLFKVIIPKGYATWNIEIDS